MALTLSQRILRFNFDPTWFAHPARLASFGESSEWGSDSLPNLGTASTALRDFGLTGRWCFNFDWAPSRLSLLSSHELDGVLAQLALLALPEFRTLVVRREDREWIRAMPAASYEGAAGVGDVFREHGEFKPASGVLRDVRLAMRRHGAALWLALGRELGDAGLARMRLMLEPALEVPTISLPETHCSLLHHGFVSSVNPQHHGEWSWLR
ncbi:MAG: hypothetical protein RIR70_2262 [Pseudomonadota bacterium]|jgi:hypothetical protein